MVKFQDNTVRDGMQQHNVNKNFRTKLSVFELIGQSNVDSVEIGMCASEDDYTMICEEAKKLSNNQEVVVLTRLVKQDIDITARLKKKVNQLTIKLLVPISDLHIEKKLGLTRESMKSKLENCLNYLQQLNIRTDICFEDATRADKLYFMEVLQLCNKYPVHLVTIADTVGCMVPEEFGAYIREIKQNGYNFGISVHCHNDLGLATANSIAGVLNGAEQVETTFLGIGERAGNTSIEEVSYILYKKYGIKSNINFKDIILLANKISEILEFPIAATKPIIGDNVFIHESGIHQDGMMKDCNMYQFVQPEEFGTQIKPLDLNISGISSSKILSSRISKEFGNLDDTKEIVNFYRKASKIINHITLEEACDLYKFINLLQTT